MFTPVLPTTAEDAGTDATTGATAGEPASTEPTSTDGVLAQQVSFSLSISVELEPRWSRSGTSQCDADDSPRTPRSRDRRASR
jgi:hypothetical protein